MRLALGATRRRLVRQWLTESLLFASLGGGLGLLCAIWTQSALLYFLPASERMNLGRTALDPAVFAFALAAAVVTAILFGIVPALQISRGALLSAAGRPAAGAERHVAATFPRRARSLADRALPPAPHRRRTFPAQSAQFENDRARLR